MDTQLFKGVEIERCAGCGAVLLDPGELEELAGKDQSGGLFAALLGLNKS
jgi:Zn-finger nucleic acid-binding protein